MRKNSPPRGILPADREIAVETRRSDIHRPSSSIFPRDVTSNRSSRARTLRKIASFPSQRFFFLLFFRSRFSSPFNVRSTPRHNLLTLSIERREVQGSSSSLAFALFLRYNSTTDFRGKLKAAEVSRSATVRTKRLK